MLGYCLTASTREQMLAIFWGGGSNGKSTLLETMLSVLGADYAIPVKPELLMRSRGERHPTEVASLFGKRLAIASESDDGRQLNEGLVKQLTGGDKLQARRMREDFWEFSPTHKIVLQTNHK